MKQIHPNLVRGFVLDLNRNAAVNLFSIGSEVELLELKKHKASSEKYVNSPVKEELCVHANAEAFLNDMLRKTDTRFFSYDTWQTEEQTHKSLLEHNHPNFFAVKSDMVLNRLENRDAHQFLARKRSLFRDLFKEKSVVNAAFLTYTTYRPYYAIQTDPYKFEIAFHAMQKFKKINSFRKAHKFLDKYGTHYATCDYEMGHISIECLELYSQKHSQSILEEFGKRYFDASTYSPQQTQTHVTYFNLSGDSTKKVHDTRAEVTSIKFAGTREAFRAAEYPSIDEFNPNFPVVVSQRNPLLTDHAQLIKRGRLSWTPVWRIMDRACLSSNTPEKPRAMYYLYYAWVLREKNYCFKQACSFWFCSVNFNPHYSVVNYTLVW